MFNKDVVNPSRMKRKIVKPRILLLDCPLEYKKGENQTAVELTQSTDFAELLRQEEEVWRGSASLLLALDRVGFKRSWSSTLAGGQENV